MVPRGTGYWRRNNHRLRILNMTCRLYFQPKALDVDTITVNWWLIKWPQPNGQILRQVDECLRLLYIKPRLFPAVKDMPRSITCAPLANAQILATGSRRLTGPASRGNVFGASTDNARPFGTNAQVVTIPVGKFINGQTIVYTGQDSETPPADTFDASGSPDDVLSNLFGVFFEVKNEDVFDAFPTNGTGVVPLNTWKVSKKVSFKFIDGAGN